MKDEEIIKALECCTNDDNEPNCKECTKRPHIYCICELLEDAYDLIHRQQERIERLKDNLDAVLAERATLDVDMVIEKLKEKSYGFEGLEYIDLDTAMAIVQGGANDDR